jgi:hypothetical protein
MNQPDPLERLGAFYEALDRIPTPLLDVQPTPKKGFWILALTPFGAAIITAVFISLCATGPAAPSISPRLRSSVEDFAVQELKSLAPPVRLRGHAVNERGRVRLG